MSSSPVSGALPAPPLPVFRFTGRGDDFNLCAPVVADRRFMRRAPAVAAATPPDAARAARLDVSAASLPDAHPLLKSLSNSRSVTNLVLSDSLASAGGGGSGGGSAEPSPPASGRQSPVGGGGGGDAMVGRLQAVLAHTEALRRLELNLAHSDAAWSAQLPQVLRCIDRTLQDLTLSLPALTPEAAEAVSDVLANPHSQLVRLSVATTTPLTAALATALADGLHANARLTELALRPVPPSDVAAVVAAVRAAALAADGARAAAAALRASRAPPAGPTAALKLALRPGGGALHLPGPLPAAALKLEINGVPVDLAVDLAAGRPPGAA